jgi:hypothetical protein
LIARASCLLLGALVFHVLLVQPNHPAAVSWSALRLIPLELPVILLALCAVPEGHWSRMFRLILVTILVAVAVLKTADLAMHSALGRSFNPVADMSLIEAGLRLSAGAIGPLFTVAAAVGALGSVAVFAWAAWWASGVWVRVAPTQWAARSAGAVAVLCAGVAAAEVGQSMGRWSLSANLPGAAFTARVGIEKLALSRETLVNLRAFKAAAANDEYAESQTLLDAIDRDVLIIFVESYGRASLETPLYADTHRATLADAQARLAGLGLSMRSGLLEAPTRGGQSWLSHATFANGLWVSDQTSYGAVLASGRQTLFHMATGAGFRTAAVMPQITLDWPESAVMGFDTVLAAGDLGYRGKPFNWVTMPDQFTLAALDRHLRAGDHHQPLFAQVALGSSHAPWVPVPDWVPWENIGDGRIFNDMAEAGDPPDVVWRDKDRVREQYRKAIDYALRVVFDYIARHADTPPLVLVVGDHQAAGFVALDERPDVPVHLIGPKHLVDRAQNWGWNAGLLPDSESEVIPMDRMRDMILEAFSDRTLAEVAR